MSNNHPWRRFHGRKLLVASIGVATVKYVVACTGSGPNLFTTSANLLAPPILDAATRAAGDGSEVDAGEDDLDEVGR
jgi:hypothetical protein